MISINQPYGAYIPPPTPPPPPAPPPSNPDGTPREPEVIIVIGKRNPEDPYRPLLPYGGLTGAQESARRDMEWAGSHPWDRVEAMGMRSQDFDDISRDGERFTTLELNDEASLIEAAYQWSPGIDVVALIRDGVEETLSQSIDNQKTGRIGEEAARLHMQTRGLTVVEDQVRVIVTDEHGNPRVRIYDFLVREANGDLKFIEVKTNGAPRKGRQVLADSAMETSGGTFGTSKFGVSTLPRIIPPTTVEVWNIFLPPRGT